MARANGEAVPETVPQNRTCHQRLVGRLAADGWRTRGWRPAAAEAFLRLAELTGSEDAWIDTEGLLEWLDAMPRYVPDGWRIRLEGTKEGWGHPVLALEFVEVEVSHHLPEHKSAAYQDAWWTMDATEYAHFRLHVMDRFGNLSCPDLFNDSLMGTSRP